MKNLTYFVIGLVVLPINGLITLVTYIRDCGETFISNYKLEKRFREMGKKS